MLAAGAPGCGPTASGPLGQVRIQIQTDTAGGLVPLLADGLSLHDDAGDRVRLPQHGMKASYIPKSRQKDPS